MKLKMIMFVMMMTVGLGAQAADYKRIDDGQAKKAAKGVEQSAQSQAADGARDRYMASIKEERDNGGATPPTIRRMPLNQ